jgi:hypothetical protein
MVILRDLDDEGGFTSIPPLGSATERQIYFHSIRWDGSLDEYKYVSEMLNFVVTESDSDSSSSSSSDSDRVIIPRSSFTGKELVPFKISRPPLNEKELENLGLSAATMLTRSKFHSQDSVQALRGAIKVSGSGKECDVIVEPVDSNDLATMVNLEPPPPHFF